MILPNTIFHYNTSFVLLNQYSSIMMYKIFHFNTSFVLLTQYSSIMKNTRKDKRPYNWRKALTTMSSNLCYALLSGSDIDDTLIDWD